MRRFKNIIFFVILAVAVSCDGLKIPKNIFDTSERAKYERRFSGPDSLMTLWKSEYAAAAQNKLKITDGFSGIALSGENNLSALAYSLELEKGDQLIIEANTDNPKTKIFIDVYQPSLGAESSKSGLLSNGTFSRFIEDSGTYKVIIQPEIEYAGTFSYRIYTQPSLGFPVAGKGNRDIQSFWGAVRDGGSRNHEGVDIFAAKGTPVVAATNGYITRTGNSGLGGKQVWQRDGIPGNSLYYAHLDSIMVQGGDRVKTGDTLGLVGSTGNAEGGAPHLHFGIYNAGGAADPYPYLRKRAVPEFKNTILPSATSVKGGSNLRSGPGTQFPVIYTLEEKMAAKVLAADGEWFHMKTASGLEGFVSRARLE